MPCLRNESLPTVLPGYPGNKLLGHRFVNGDDFYRPGLGKVMKWQMSANPQGAEKKADAWTPAVTPCAEAFSSKEDMLVWLGHASFLLRIGGISLLFDPILVSSFGLRHRHALPCQPEEVQNIDGLLLSHGHRDHADARTLQIIAKQNPRMIILSSLGMNALVQTLVPGLPAPVQEAGWWQQYQLPAAWAAKLEICYLPAAHWHRRSLFDVNRVLWGSFLIRTATSKLVYFAGDTGHGDHFAAIARHFGPVDLALMPIGAYKPPFIMQRSHLNPSEAAQAANTMQARHVVPMHHGTFDLSDEPASEPLRLFRETAAAAGNLAAALHTPAVGEVMRWSYWE